MKLTDTQKEQILKTRDIIAAIQKTCDELYDKLVIDIGFDVYASKFETDPARSNPESWLFDIVYNTEGESDLQESFAALENAIIYDTTI